MDGEILFHGQNLLALSDAEIQELRGSKISMIFQEPSTALNPVVTIGNQICESLMIHRKMKKKEAMAEAVELLRRVNIPNPEQRVKQYPFEFSGGMQQRAMIAMAMSCNPEILIADEPTTALDVTVQAQVLEQLNQLRLANDMALIIITHNLGVVARYADSVKVVYGGKIVEEGTTYDFRKSPSSLHHRPDQRRASTGSAPQPRTAHHRGRAPRYVSDSGQLLRFRPSVQVRHRGVQNDTA
jgi:ABC-type dipeptide/oligopeptide/nickel transport system ATPase component